MECNKLKIVIVDLLVATGSVAQEKRGMSCEKYYSIMKEVRNDVDSRDRYDRRLERLGFVTDHSVFGIRNRGCEQCRGLAQKIAKIDTVGAQTFKKKFNMSEKNYISLATRCKYRSNNDGDNTKRPKYRSIDGRNNNAKNPDWGAAGTPFSRFGPKNYEDGIYTIKKSATGSDLPNARLLMEEVLTKAVRAQPPSLAYNVLGLLIILFATHDLHYQNPVQPKNISKEIQCCTADRHAVLHPKLLNSACLPVEVSRNDSFYKNEEIGCLNMVRSQIGEYPKTIQAGEIYNEATAYLDLSLIYGNRESELEKIRLFKNGTFRMGIQNLLPVDENGKYLQSMDRFVAVPIACIWPALFTRNHNHYAERLAALNPHWDDEIIFQEARRINIANFQFNLITAKSIERVFHTPVNESYSPLRNAATSTEFTQTYRGAHYYTPSTMQFLDENYTLTNQFLQSDTIGRIDLLDNDFDGAFRGLANQVVNMGPYSDEILHRIGKTRENGPGIDIISIDIQRSRDHGIASFVEMRRKCKLKPEINSFDDFELIFNKTNVNLLKKIYNSYEEVDFYVGGLLEAFEKVGNPFAGPTFGCVIGENYKNVMGGDIYFYSHPENPYPHTREQIAAIRKYSVSNLFCVNTGINETNQLWSYAPHEKNPKIDCKKFPPLDLSAWKEEKKEEK